MQSDDLDQKATQTPKSGHRRWRPAAQIAAVTALGILAAACGGGSRNASSDPSGASAAPWSTARVIAYVDCMRSHGVPDYPEPGSSNGAAGSAGINPSSPAFQSARTKCYKLMPGGTPKTHATEQQIRQALETARCMRDHGLPDFPDPIVTSTVPTPPGGPPSSGGSGYTQEYGDGILFKIPSSITDSPVFDAAAKACDAAQQFGVNG
jgi:hypothetical protein